jgi:hypothetical protein
MDEESKQALMTELARMEELEREDTREREREREAVRVAKGEACDAERRLAVAKEVELRALCETAKVEAEVVRIRGERVRAEEELLQVRRAARVAESLALHAEARADTCHTLVEGDTVEMQATIDQSLLSYRIAKLAEIDEVKEEAEHLWAQLAKEEAAWTADDRTARQAIAELEATVKNLVAQTTQLERALTETG